MRFQFHKGAIRTLGDWRYQPLGQLFQFHKGAIRTTLPTILCNLVPLFQFHKGAIRTHRCKCYHILLAHFNSIKVRLEREAM